MNEPVLSVKFFRTEKGGEPVREFLRGLLPEDRKIIGTDIKEVHAGDALGAKNGKRPLGNPLPS